MRLFKGFKVYIYIYNWCYLFNFSTSNHC